MHAPIRPFYLIHFTYTNFRSPKHFHVLLVEEKHLGSIVRKIVPKHIADPMCKKETRITHLNWLKCIKRISSCNATTPLQNGWMEN